MKLLGSRRGFTLVEVVLALAITATAVVLLMALLPLSVDAIGDSHRTGRAQSCAEFIFADLRAGVSIPEVDGEPATTEFLEIILPEPGEAVERTVYFDGGGIPVDGEAEADFRATLNLRRTGDDPDLLVIDYDVRWPAATGSVRGGSVEIWGTREL